MHRGDIKRKQIEVTDMCGMSLDYKRDNRSSTHSSTHLHIVPVWGRQ